MTQRVIEAALDFADLIQEGGGLSTHPILEALCLEMAPLWVERLVDKRYPDPVAAALIELLARHAPAAAVLACRRIAGASEAGPAAAAAWSQLARLDPNFVVDHIDDIAEDTAREQTVPYIALDRIDDERLHTLTGRLLDSMSYADDPIFDETQYGSGPHNMRRTRDASLTELTKRGLVDELRALQIEVCLTKCTSERV